jgi:hypothetical protein
MDAGPNSSATTSTTASSHRYRWTLDSHMKVLTCGGLKNTPTVMAKILVLLAEEIREIIFII